ncbi:ATP-binding cassette domain-containing protein [Deinococcus cellulosilyticus]|uniref:ABC transporter permease n=1 Tax=Deinococcus cellulosilyticus (strain DSM 18568 / NBRC 106333 / KACC 11606 / 5516J-15) TaxID=1223518 RepID=A0A511N376_DEIC1|nr:ABC transporter ATP-binding protein [Deinococcus cellulosilyticus]GEM46908.1 ABC transporter permease [Deinococcus cellulosilyticus NBRC 106333 = KACC 11606]
MIRLLHYLIGNHKKAFVIAIVWGVLYALAMSILNPLAIKLLFDEAVMKQNFSLFVMVASGSLLLFVGLRLVDYHYRLFKQRLSNRMLLDLALRVTRAYFRIPYARILEKGEGYFVARTYDEVQASVQPTQETILGLFRSAATLLGGLVTILLISWKLTLALALVAPILLKLSRKYGGKIHRDTRAEQERSAELRDVTLKVMQSYKTIRIFQLLSKSMEQYRQRFESYLQANYLRTRNMTVYSALSGVFLSIMEMLVIVAGGYSIMTSNLTFGGLMAFMNAFWLTVNALQSLVDSVPRMAMIRATTTRLMEFEAEAQQEDLPANPAGNLVLQNVEFSYGSQRMLHGVNLNVQAGQRLLIEGPNGSGKSTLAHVLSGLLVPVAGQISLPGRVSAVVEPVNFPGLTLFQLLSQFDADRCENLAARFGLSDLLHHTYGDLSLGQKKKLGVLMCLLKDADCYILDEPLANLDRSSEDTVMEAIFEATAGKTLLVILHGSEKHHARFDGVLRVQQGTVQTHVGQVKDAV